MHYSQDTLKLEKLIDSRMHVKDSFGIIKPFELSKVLFKLAVGEALGMVEQMMIESQSDFKSY